MGPRNCMHIDGPRSDGFTTNVEIIPLLVQTEKSNVLIEVSYQGLRTSSRGIASSGLLVSFWLCIKNIFMYGFKLFFLSLSIRHVDLSKSVTIFYLQLLYNDYESYNCKISRISASPKDIPQLNSLKPV